MAQQSRAAPSGRAARDTAPPDHTNGSETALGGPPANGAATDRAARPRGEPAQTDRPPDRPAVTVDVVILTVRNGRLEVLLARRKRWPFDGMWAIPGGFIALDESLEDAARRELDEAIGVRDVYLEQLYTFGDPARDPRMRVITVVYYALLRSDHLAIQTAPGATEAAWFPMYNPPDLAFDHGSILRYTLQRLRGKLEYTTIGYQLLGEEFTLSELQDVYEVILGKKIDKRNFRRKVLQTGILAATTRSHRAGQHRPARLYRFNPNAEP